MKSELVMIDDTTILDTTVGLEGDACTVVLPIGEMIEVAVKLDASVVEITAMLELEDTMAS